MNDLINEKKEGFIEKFKWFFNSNPNESLEMLIFLQTALHQAIAVGRKEALEEIEALKPVADIDIRGGAWLVEKEEVIKILQNHDTKKE